MLIVHPVPAQKRTRVGRIVEFATDSTKVFTISDGEARYACCALSQSCQSNVRLGEVYDITFTPKVDKTVYLIVTDIKENGTKYQQDESPLKVIKTSHVNEAWKAINPHQASRSMVRNAILASTNDVPEKRGELICIHFLSSSSFF